MSMYQQYFEESTYNGKTRFEENLPLDSRFSNSLSVPQM
jgi:hypothetical protein